MVLVVQAQALGLLLSFPKLSTEDMKGLFLFFSARRSLLHHLSANNYSIPIMNI